MHGDRGHFAPRVGIAWQPGIKRRTVVRAGYSMFYNENVYSTLARKLTYQPPFDVAESLITSSANILTLQQGLLQQPGIAITNTAAVSPFYRVPYAQIWMLGTETDCSRARLGSEHGLYGHQGNRSGSVALAKPCPRSALRRQTSNRRGCFLTQPASPSINPAPIRSTTRFQCSRSCTGSRTAFPLQVQYTYSKSIDNASSVKTV